jgi:hypothetical protein
MPRNLDRLDLTRPARRALLGRLLDIIDGEEAVRQVYWHAKHAAEALAKAENDCTAAFQARDALAAEALTSARAALPGLETLVLLAEAELETTQRNEASYRRWNADKPALWPSYEKELARRQDSIKRARADVEEMRAIITAYAPDEDLVGKHSADLAEVGAS